MAPEFFQCCRPQHLNSTLTLTRPTPLRRGFLLRTRCGRFGAAYAFFASVRILRLNVVRILRTFTSRQTLEINMLHPINASLLPRLLKYEPDTGLLFWLPRTPDLFVSKKDSAECICRKWNGKHAGNRAFTAYEAYGYLHGAIYDRLYRAHRVAWALQYGRWPSQEIDHINGVRDDNSLVNLREVSPSTNSRNRRLSVKNRSGVCGVYWVKRTKRWRATIRVDGRKKHLGDFIGIQDAARARRCAEQEHGYHPNHGQPSPSISSRTR